MLKISPSGLVCNGSWSGDLHFFVGDELFCFTFNVDDLGEELGGNCVVTLDTLPLAVPLPDELQTLNNDEFWDGSTACTSDPMATRVRSTLLSCLCCPKTLGTSPPDVYWIFISWKPNTVQKWCVAFLNIEMRKRRYIQIVVWVTLWNPDEQKFFLMKTLSSIFRYNFWPVIIAYSFPANFTSFFVWLVIFSRIWHGFSLWTGSGSEFWQSWRVLAMITPHHFHVFLHALSTRVSFWKSLTPHHVEDLVSVEQ